MSRSRKRAWGRLATVAASLVLLGLVAPVLFAQDSGGEIAKRKVKVRVAPEYPELAKEMNVTGKVKVEVVISQEGRVRSTHVVGGSPLLVNATLAALKDWRFESAPKETIEILEFDFKRGGN